jgi:hypothetical protein
VSEPSPEAVVAAEAAGSAVEELHSREAVADAAVTAEIIAGDAELQAEEAAETATVAAELASEAVAMAAQANAESEAARDEAQQVASTGDRALQAIEALRNQMEPIFQRYANEEAERIAAENAPPVEEVDVTNAGGTGNSGGESAGSGSGNNHTGSGQSGGNTISDNGPNRPAGKLRRGRRPARS